MIVMEIGKGVFELQVTLDEGKIFISGDERLTAETEKLTRNLYWNSNATPSMGDPDVIIASELIKMFGGKIIQHTANIDSRLVY